MLPYLNRLVFEKEIFFLDTQNLGAGFNKVLIILINDPQFCNLGSSEYSY